MKLTKAQRNAGLSLDRTGKHIYLMRDGHFILRIFNRDVTEQEVRQEADKYLNRK